MTKTFVEALPQTAEEWAGTYQMAVTVDDWSPRACKGELMIFNAVSLDAAAEQSNDETRRKPLIVALTFGPPVKTLRTPDMVGILQRATPKLLFVKMPGADKAERVRRDAVQRLDVCVGIMTPLHDANARNNAALNAAIRQRDGLAA